MDVNEFFEETIGETTRTRRYNKEIDGSDHTEVRVSTTVSGHVASDIIRWGLIGEGTKCGKKSRTAAG